MQIFRPHQPRNLLEEAIKATNATVAFTGIFGNLFNTHDARDLTEMQLIDYAVQRGMLGRP